jgi:tRNA threonylcarbamoyladenosine biosynthesis protein TsaB
MKILAIDSSGLTATVALVWDGVMIAEYTTNFKKTHSQTLLPMIDEIVRMTGTVLSDIDGIAIAEGPGSFTGLRIGSATAKGLALVLKKPIIGVPTVEGLAYNFFGSDRVICPIMDARRNQVYTGLYTFEGEKFQILSDQKAVSIEEILQEVNDFNRPTVFLGDGVPVFQNKIKELAKGNVIFAPAHLCMQRAAAVAVRGEVLYKEGRWQKPEEHHPVYLRKPQAEREREEANK